jgi:2-C-methyl-D-erythritol 4-phosphate cytidylyltransferase
MTTFALIIPAAGSGSRSGQHVPKQYIELAGSLVLTHTLLAFSNIPGCMEIIIATNSAWRSTTELCAKGFDTVNIIAGGNDRQHSIANALASLGGTPELVLVHDAVRPCVSPALIERVIGAATEHGAAIPVLPVTETLKRVNADGLILETLPRAEIRTAQTPQGFRRELLIAAYRYAADHGIVATDDASLVEAYGAGVYTVDGEQENIKITWPGDFERAEATLRRMYES